MIACHLLTSKTAGPASPETRDPRPACGHAGIGWTQSSAEEPSGQLSSAVFGGPLSSPLSSSTRGREAIFISLARGRHIHKSCSKRLLCVPQKVRFSLGLRLRVPRRAWHHNIEKIRQGRTPMVCQRASAAVLAMKAAEAHVQSIFADGANGCAQEHRHAMPSGGIRDGRARPLPLGSWLPGSNRGPRRSPDQPDQNHSGPEPDT